MAVKRIGILTSGGDAPGMNAAIRSAVRIGLANDLEVMGVCRGYYGLIQEEIMPLNHRSVSNIISRGGTMLKSSRCPEFKTKEGQKKAAEVIKDKNIDALVIIGGEGSYHGALALAQDWGIPCVGVPGTIDNDINGTDYTIGSDTALNTALHAIDKIRDTVTSLERVFIVEVMGRLCGYIALNVALAGGAEQVVIPEKKFDIYKMCEEISEGYIRGKASWIIVVAEGVITAEEARKQIASITDLETRTVVLGHIQRGGSPTAKDRILATRLGAAAVEALIKGEKNIAISIKSDEIYNVSLKEALMKKPIKTDELCSLIKIVT